MPLDVVAAASVERRALRFGEGLFGWYHAADAGGRDIVVVLCPPMGPEYTRSHRTLRHLADRLALAGIPALRFDYHGVGDSAGDEDDPDRVGHWRARVAAPAIAAISRPPTRRSVSNAERGALA